MSNLTASPSPVNLMADTAVVIRLVDADDVVYDERVATLGDLGLLNAAAHDASDGELWWDACCVVDADGRPWAV